MFRTPDSPQSHPRLTPVQPAGEHFGRTWGAAGYCHCSCVRVHKVLIIRLERDFPRYPLGMESIDGMKPSVKLSPQVFLELHEPAAEGLGAVPTLEGLF